MLFLLIRYALRIFVLYLGVYLKLHLFAFLFQRDNHITLCIT